MRTVRPRPPKTVTCEGATITLEQVPFIGRITGRYQTGGQYFHSSSKVKVVNTMTLVGEQAVVMHELMHHLADRSGLSAEFGGNNGGERVERILDYLDSWLVALLQQNPDLVEYLTAGPQGSRTSSTTK